ncbi:RAMP superfamily CRISPR-associated protein [Phytohabitans flavus]|uniref:RAMP superfamily CRISPR-associated protein n=1 Tax=Phytohabitans flavus TaxID=1076124 RepID=UPI0036273CCF
MGARLVAGRVATRPPARARRHGWHQPGNHPDGQPPPKQHDEAADASRLWLLGTRFDADPTPTGRPGVGGEPLLETVGQTGIDRRRGAATATSLRYSRTVACGGVLTAYLRFDGELDAAHLTVLAAWQPAIGRDRSTGGGQARLSRLRHGTIDPCLARGARLWLTHHGEALVAAVATTDLPIAAVTPEAWLVEDLLIEDALLVGDPRPTGPASPRTRGGRPLIPGSAWKGVIRSRVEYILRSLYGAHAACTQPGGCGTCPTCHVFGHQKARGLLAFADSTIDTTWQPATSVRTQVGIDRVTGGSRDRMLFQTDPVTSGRLQLRIDALGPVEDWVRVAVRHVLRDLHDGLIGVGSQVTRGMGTLRLANPPNPPGPVNVPGLTAPPGEPTRPEVHG